FNFMENGNSERWVTGAFLSEREDRLSYGEATSMDLNALVVMAEHGEVTRQLTTTGIHDHEPIVFVRPGVNLDDDPVIRLGNESGSAEFKTSVGGYDLTWGRWNGSAAGGGTDGLLLWDNLDTGDYTPLKERTFWLAYEDVADLSSLNVGRFNKVVSHLGSDQVGRIVDHLEFSFDVDFQSGAISNGRMLVREDDFETHSGKSRWDLTFQGWVNDGEASFSDFNGTYRQRESDDWEHAITNAMIEGSFVDKRAMAGAYLLEAP